MSDTTRRCFQLFMPERQFLLLREQPGGGMSYEPVSANVTREGETWFIEADLPDAPVAYLPHCTAPEYVGDVDPMAHGGLVALAEAARAPRPLMDSERAQMRRDGSVQTGEWGLRVSGDRAVGNHPEYGKPPVGQGISHGLTLPPRIRELAAAWVRQAEGADVDASACAGAQQAAFLDGQAETFRDCAKALRDLLEGEEG